MYYSEIMADWIVNLKYEDLPLDVVEMAKLCLQDWFAAVLYDGAESDWSKVVTEIALEMEGKPEATILVKNRKVPAATAAMANSIMSLAYDITDTYPLAELHPSCSVMAAALAMAEKMNSSGKDLITAIVASYEVVCRTAGAMNMRPFSFVAKRGFEANSLFPPFGAIVAAGKLSGLNREQLVNAIGVGGGAMGASTLDYLRDGNWTYRNNPARGAMNGIISTLMAQRGYVGPRALFEGIWDDKGRYGVINALAGDMSLKSHLVERLGEDWQILRIGFKYFGCCHYIHGYAAGASLLMKDQNIGPEEIEEITVNVPYMTIWLASPRQIKWRPANLTIANWSLPFSLATVVMDGHLLNPRVQFSEDRLVDPRVLAMADRITVIKDESLDKIFAERQEIYSPLKLRLKSGKEYQTTQPCKGFIYSPLTQEEHDHKFRTLSSHSIDVSKVTHLKAALKRLETMSDVSPLISLTSRE